MSDNDKMPFGLPSDDAGFRAALRRLAGHARRKHGPAAPATSAIQCVLLDAIAEAAAGRDPARGFWRRLSFKLIDRFRRDQLHRQAVAEVAGGLREDERSREAARPGEDHAMAREAEAALDRAAAGLSPADQEVLRRLRLGESYAGIAASVGRTPGAVKQAAFRIRATLAQWLPRGFRPEDSTGG